MLEPATCPPDLDEMERGQPEIGFLRLICIELHFFVGAPTQETTMNIVIMACHATPQGLAFESDTGCLSRRMPLPR